jgi:hypothetical protein
VPLSAGTFRRVREGSGGSARPRALPGAFALVAAVLVLVLGVTVGQPAAPVAAAKARISLVYEVLAVPKNYEICVGDHVAIAVSVLRRMWTNGVYSQGDVDSATVTGKVTNPSVGHLEPPVDKAVGTLGYTFAQYRFFADSIGTAKIEFTIKTTGEEELIDVPYTTKGADYTVKVIPCFDAYTSGLATVFDTRDMGGLDKPFFLEGHIASAGLEGVTQYMFFVPQRRNRKAGVYAFIDTAWAVIGPGGRCTAYISGHYDVTFYPNDQNIVEGDLLMKGSGEVVCTGYAYSVNYQAAPGFQIGFKPRPTPPPP